MKSRGVSSILIVCLATILTLAGCSTPTPSPTPTGVQNAAPWPGVPVFTDPNIQVIVRVGETFSIVLPPAPLFGWGWQNSDSSAFSLVETRTVQGSGNETNPFGPNAFLFKALETGEFPIVLYVASKPPQQLETFDVVVNP